MESTKGADMTGTTRSKLVEYGWGDLPNSGITPDTSPRDWMKLHALAVDAYEQTRDFSSLAFEQLRALVDASASGLPITLTHRNRVRGYDRDRIETTTRTYVVRQFMNLSGSTTANLYVKSWGVSFPIALRDLVDVEVPAQTFHPTEYVDAA